MTQLAAREPSSFEYWLHATEPFDDADPADIRLRAGEVGCRIGLPAPEGLSLTQTDQYDPNPRRRIKLREWHVTAATSDKRKTVEFVAVYRPYRLEGAEPQMPRLEQSDAGYALRTAAPEGTAVILLPVAETAIVEAHGLKTTGKPLAALLRDDGSVAEQVVVDTR